MRKCLQFESFWEFFSQRNMDDRQLEDRDQLIFIYFHFGLTYKEIQEMLEIKHGVVLSLRQLKRKLALMRLFRRKYYSDIEDVAMLFNANRKHPANFMDIDLKNLRRRPVWCKRANSLWHGDSYDKLKPYGSASMDALMGIPDT
ncbi:hypothetical protein KUTeg_015661 [Tegillarca granosa]|uniref:RNA polymerase sigma-70 region 4 domain-containing protein n=1 Tax=Tegillarca granosa TaxID=220873 RepID=A0ABQ9ENF4_TEGGR|nr:hypothetical protein KUTeg_015661 [Tegillarca granosa]